MMLSLGCAGAALGGADMRAQQMVQEEVRRELEAIKADRAREAAKRADVDAELLLALEDIETRLERLENQLRDLLDGLGRTQPRPLQQGPAVVDGPTPQDARSVYEAAYLQVTRGHYDLAISAMDEFVRQYSASDLADNAIYWIGESHYAQHRFNQAVEAFVRLIDAYPDGDKVPAALLKLGYTFAEMGDAPTSRRYLESVIDQHPGSEEAALARTRLEGSR